ncbi:efflux RND transporter permease subunit [Thermosediminibacter oceani]|uniref:Acriflavin resistance protein n=1 Tax=Thermosediminibacter oceani (strain ATCC BAA-1034 / DSM 16646 / JW/IW-1228P) TaxID=555079 RepID=D9S0M3_THEOJ|nr:efflux RND transporter permease subunit [Thermosediminibacter oceani]ADL08881.1 acriflavin resistance protein [Thermosediminibacter oceani DSM 16646]
MSLAKFSIKHPVTMTMIVVIVLVLGAVSLDRLGTDLLPDISFPTLMVITEYSGAGPEEVENLVTKPLEQVLTTVSNVKSIRSTSLEGVSNITVEFNWGTDMDFAVLDVREKIDLIKDALPSDVRSPQIYKYDASQIPVMEIAVYGGEDLSQLKKIAEDKIKNRLLQIEGVGMVQVFGGTKREIHIIVDPDKLVRYGITMDTVIRTLQAENLNLPGGAVSYGKREYLIRSISEFKDISEIKELPLAVSGGGSIPLSSVAKIEEVEETDVLSRLNKKPSVVLLLYKQSGFNTVQVSERVLKELEELRKELPADAGYDVVFDQADFINKSLGEVVENAVSGALLAVAVLYLFLRDLRTTLIIGISIPISIITTFILVYFNKITLNLMSLGGLALGVGMLVDNSIVVLDNIFRHREEGEDRVTAAISGTDEVTRAVMATTLTTVVVFLPIVFVEGITAQLFKELALTVTYSLLASLAVSLTLIPLLSSRLIGGEKKEQIVSGPAGLGRKFDAAYKRVLAFYGNLLKWALNHRKTVIGVAAAAFVVSLALIPLVGSEFLPKFDTGMITMTVQMPDGTRIEEMERAVDEINSKLDAIPEIESVLNIIGFSNQGQENDNEATIMVRLKPLAERKRTSDEVAEEIRQRTRKMPGVKVNVSSMGGMMFLGAASEPISIKIRGDDLEKLKSISEEVVNIVKSVPGTREVESSLARQRPEINIKIDKDKASLYGLNSAYVANYVKTAVQGSTATRFRMSGDEIDVKVKAESSLVDDIGKLKSLTIPSPTGVMVPLSGIAEVTKAQGPISIEREDQTRVIKVTGSVLGRFSGEVNREIQEKLKSLRLPEGYSIEMGGEQEQMMESFRSLFLAFLLASLLVYMVMAAEFESLVQPFVIMFTVPLSVIGVVLSLLLTGRSLNIASIIGIIMLVGIVVDNAIVLIDFVNQLRQKGLSREEAILKAGPIRLRPILMTTLTTILGLFPLALGFGEGGEMRASLATAVIGGLLVSTMLTLVVIPVIYTVFEDFEKIIGRIKLRMNGIRIFGR